MDLKITKFGKFKLIQKIARGGMAEIYLACTGSITNAHKFVVIKRISLMHSHSQEFNKMFQSEGKIAINLNHSNIGSIYEFGKEDDQYFICMEYISGRNIRQLVKKLKSQKKNLSMECCAHIIKYACSGLDYAHNSTDNMTGQPLNIIHRDVSPQNIMISFGGDIKVIDFGIAKIDDSEATKAGVLKGKFEYMSPEQARGKDIDKQTDIFSLGNVLWELLAGRKLFTGANEIQLLKKIRDCQIPDLKKINPKVPDKLASIVNKALNANKHLRYKTIADMGNDISVFLNKHYPNWTNSHFSSFIKEVYIEEIMEERKNLKAYSQALKKSVTDQKRIKGAHVLQETYSSKFKGYTPEFEEKTQMDDQTESFSDMEATVSVIDKDFDEERQYTETETRSKAGEQKTELTKTKFEDPLDSKTSSSPLKKSYTITRESENRSVITTSITPGKDDPPPSSYSPWHSVHKNKPASQRLIMEKKNKRRRKFFRKSFLFLSVMGILPATYFFSPEVKHHTLNMAQKLKELASQNQLTQVADEWTQADTQKEAETTSPSSQPKRNPTALSPSNQARKKIAHSKTVKPVHIWLTTKPSGAQVYVNGVRAHGITPVDISVDPNQRTEVLITKRSYQNKKITLSLNEIRTGKAHYGLKKKKGASRNEVIIR